MKGIVFACFGTTHDAARAQGIAPVARALRGAFPGEEVVVAYTSGIVRTVLAGRGAAVPGVGEALEGLAERGVREVLVQPGQVLYGEEHDKAVREARGLEGRFERLVVSTPLLSCDADIAALAATVADAFPQQPGRDVVLMGHGTRQFSNAGYAALDYRLAALGRPDVHVGTVEAYPDRAAVLRILRSRGVGRVTLAPLMLVAGDHAVNDMAGQGAGSWASVLRAEGLDVECRINGLGAWTAVQQMFVAHALCAWGA